MTKSQLPGGPGAIQASLALYPETHLADRGRKGAEMVLKKARAETARAEAQAKRDRRAERNRKALGL